MMIECRFANIFPFFFCSFPSRNLAATNCCNWRVGQQKCAEGHGHKQLAQGGDMTLKPESPQQEL